MMRGERNGRPVMVADIGGKDGTEPGLPITDAFRFACLLGKRNVERREVGGSKPLKRHIALRWRTQRQPLKQGWRYSGSGSHLGSRPLGASCGQLVKAGVQPLADIAHLVLSTGGGLPFLKASLIR